MSAEAADVPQDEPDTQTPPSTAEGRLFRICESAFILTVLAVSLVLEYGPIPEYTRDIPVQIILEGEAYVRNLLFNEEEIEESVGTVSLILVGVVLPFLLQLAMATWFSKGQKPFDRYNTFCCYFMAFSLTFVIVDMIKLYCGYFRPHFYDVCQPDDNYELCLNEDDSALRDSRGSFPSGHAGLSISGMGNFSLYLHRRYGVGSLSPEKANTKSHQMARLWSFLAVLPVLVSLYMGASRVHDNHHHPADIVAGFGIGGVAAYFCHNVWFLV